jgi:hypothetical protein
MYAVEKAALHKLNGQTIMQVRFQVFMVASVKVTVFWDAVPCSLVEAY